MKSIQNLREREEFEYKATIGQQYPVFTLNECDKNTNFFSKKNEVLLTWVTCQYDLESRLSIFATKS